MSPMSMHDTPIGGLKNEVTNNNPRYKDIVTVNTRFVLLQLCDFSDHLHLCQAFMAHHLKPLGDKRATNYGSD